MQNPLRLYSVSSKPTINICEPCNLTIFMCTVANRKHMKDPLHVSNCFEKNMFCPDTRKTFMSKASFNQHQKLNHQANMQYHCTDCAKDFPSKCALKRHPKNDAAHRKRAMGILCEPCGKTFPTGSKYDAHLLTKNHKKKASQVRCFSYPKCQRTFTSKGGMMSHLESGACKSGLNRQKIDDVIRQHDTSNVILKVGAGSSSQTIQDAVPNHAPPVAAGSIKDIDSDSDSDDEGTIILTPATATSFSRRESFADIHTPSTLSGFATPQSYTTSSHQEIPTPSTLSGYSTPRSYATGFVDTESPTSFSRRESFSDIPTPSSTLSGLSTPRSNITGFGETDLQFVFGPGFERICYICNREFSTPKALQTHLDGLAHAPRIYKCPTFLFAAQHSGKPHKDFKSLSGLVMHLESGACEGGNEALQRAIGFVEEKLNGTGRGLLQM